MPHKTFKECVTALPDKLINYRDLCSRSRFRTRGTLRVFMDLSIGENQAMQTEQCVSAELHMIKALDLVSEDASNTTES